MNTSTDPLVALRGAIKAQSNITYSDGSNSTSSLASATHIVLSPTSSFPKSTLTRLRKPGASSVNPTPSPRTFFTLQAVYLAWLLRKSSVAEYVKQAREHGLTVGFVSVTERKNVVDWLEGKTSELDGLVPLATDSTTPPGTPPKHRGTVALPATPFPSHSGDHSSPLKRRYVADIGDIEAVKKIKANEIELLDRTSVLRGIKSNNFSGVSQAMADKLKKLRDASKSGTPAMSAPSTPDPKMHARKQKHQYPIIIISSSPTALITMHNVKRFLQDAVFEPSQEARARAAAEGNARPEDMIPIYRKRTAIDSSGRETETQARYFVVDGTEALAKFGADAWDRVVCVMTTGQAWQFKPYKWNEPKTLFHHVKGFYMTWANDPPNHKIQDWNVTELKIDQHRRHIDKSVVAHFWKTLDTWTMTNKPWLMQG
ncbi:RNA polymerase II-associated protein [Rhodofomes roseus]|uniref:RNA polymerase II-associated protein n=1 Tax=Rhodofomes roseus TaxID=34475 RepID=A0ABQ8KVT3_9APHY|nr:RNA polymerase II-associated protein [Rhodofomes roseus]KAH9842453.1 RNA polymerase II-associated protein [Rhodofomes roseus]